MCRHVCVYTNRSLSLFRCLLLSASGNGAHFLQLKTEIEAMVLTHFTLIYFRLSPHTCSWAQQEEGPTELEPRGLAHWTQSWQNS